MKQILLVFGTRPEFIKLIPVILEFRKRNWVHYLKVLFTGQHREMVEPLFELFGIYPEVQLHSMVKGQSLADSINTVMNGIQGYVSENKSMIQFIMAQGDTTSCYCAARVAEMNQLPFAHIEAGLRTYHLSHPFPEELFRRIISRSATVHFAPTQIAYNNLAAEKFNTDTIHLTGNTIVDTIRLVHQNPLYNRCRNKSITDFISNKNNVLITCHRRENQNSNFDKLTTVICELAAENSALNFIWLSHLSPVVAEKLRAFKKICPANVTILPPLHFTDMYLLYPSLKIIITDSGGIQEEAVSFGIPVIVIREKTERAESVAGNFSTITGMEPKKIRDAFRLYLDYPIHTGKNPYGDGYAAERIADYFIPFVIPETSELITEQLPLTGTAL